LGNACPLAFATAGKKKLRNLYPTQYLADKDLQCIPDMYTFFIDYKRQDFVLTPLSAETAE